MKSITKTAYHTGLYYTEPLYYMLLIAVGLYDVVGFRQLFFEPRRFWDVQKLRAINILMQGDYADSLFSSVLISEEGEIFLETTHDAEFSLPLLYDKVKSIATLYETHKDVPKWRKYISRISVYINVKEASKQLADFLRIGKIVEGSPLFNGKPITDPFTRTALDNTVIRIRDACFSNPGFIDYDTLNESINSFFQLLKDNNK